MTTTFDSRPVRELSDERSSGSHSECTDRIQDPCLADHEGCVDSSARCCIALHARAAVQAFIERSVDQDGPMDSCNGGRDAEPETPEHTASPCPYASRPPRESFSAECIRSTLEHCPQRTPTGIDMTRRHPRVRANGAHARRPTHTDNTSFRRKCRRQSHAFACPGSRMKRPVPRPARADRGADRDHPGQPPS